MYKTSEGVFWYVVDPAAARKELLFDRDELASQLSEIVQDPFDAQHLPLLNLKAKEDGHTFTFEIRSTRDAKPEKKGEKVKPGEKDMFYFSYDFNTRKLTHLKDAEKEPKRLDWASVSPDQPGWFADSDGVFCIRTEKNQKGETEWVLMEDKGPGAITKIWAVCFYYGLDDTTGANLKIYLDGEEEPTINCNFFEFVKGESFVNPSLIAKKNF